jgi:GDP-L-fucose synthase
LNDNVLKAASETKSVKKVVSCLSTCIFPEHVDRYPIAENRLHQGLTHKTNLGYAYSKRMLDVLNRCYMETYPDKLFTAIVPCNIFGPNDNFNIEQGHVIPSIMHKVYNAKKTGSSELEVLGSGAPLRQFIFSEDIAKLIIWAVRNYSEQEPIIFAPKEEHSILDCANIICDVAGFRPDIKLNRSHQDGQQIKTSDNTKLLNYLPDFKFTPFREALKTTYEWFSENYALARTGKSIRIDDIVAPRKITIKMMCNWCPNAELIRIWDKMGHGNSTYTKDGVTLKLAGDEISEHDADYIVVVNSTGDKPRPSVRNLRKTIFMKMEPVFVDTFWEYVHNNPELLKARFTHLPGNYNNIEWHISKTLPELMSEGAVEKHYDKEVSAILSAKNFYPGHTLRLTFAKAAQHQLLWHSYGAPVCGIDMTKWVNYKGPLPLYTKETALAPYKYTFNCENAVLPGYHTEKLIDAILCETLCFYYGHEDVREHIDSRAYVYLDINNVGESIKTIKESVEGDLWAQRVPYIREAKRKLLEERGFFPRLFNTINNAHHI